MGNHTPVDTPDAAHAPRAPHRLSLLLAVALVLGVIATITTVQRGTPASVEERLRGDTHTVVAALGDKLTEVAEADQTPLLLKYARDASPNLRYAAIDALGERKGPGIADAIYQAYTDSASPARQRALEVLHQVDPERGYRLLLVGLRDDDTWLREAAAIQLATILRGNRFDARRAYPSLVAALDLNDPVVCSSAASTLSRLVGRPWRTKLAMSAAEREAVVHKWREWWAAQPRRAGDELPDPIHPSRVDPAPDFRLRDLDGKTYTSAELKGRITLVHFYSTKCAPCDEEMRDLGRVHAEFEARGVMMLGVAMPPHDAAEVRRWCAERGVAFPQALSTDRVAEAFDHIHAVPVSVLIDRAWRVRYRWEGERDARVYEKALERLLKE